MKNKIILAFLFAAFSIAGHSQSSSDFLNQSQMTTTSDFVNNGYHKVGLAFRHHGNGHCTCPNCVCPGCPCPIGICICTNARAIDLSNTDLTDQQISDGYGAVWVKMSTTADIMHIIFLSTNDESGVCPIDTSPYVDNTDKGKFNASSAFTISNGNYTVYTTKYTYGEAVLNISY